MSLVWIPLGIAAAAFVAVLIVLATGADPDFERRSAERSKRRRELREASRAKVLAETAAEGRPKWMSVRLWHLGSGWLFSGRSWDLDEMVPKRDP